MGPMRRVMVGFEAPNAPVEAAWARLRYPTSTQAKFANGSLEGDGRSARVEGDGRQHAQRDGGGSLDQLLDGFPRWRFIRGIVAMFGFYFCPCVPTLAAEIESKHHNDITM